MSGAGRPRVSREELKQRGTFREDRHGKESDITADEEASGGSPQKPDDLNEAQAALWDLITQRLPDAAVGEIDGPALCSLMDWWDIWLKSRDVLKDEMLLENSQSIRRAMDNATKAYDRVDKLLGKFGATPADRAKLRDVVVGKRSSDPFAKVFENALQGSQN